MEVPSPAGLGAGDVNFPRTRLLCDGCPPLGWDGWVTGPPLIPVFTTLKGLSCLNIDVCLSDCKTVNAAGTTVCIVGGAVGLWTRSAAAISFGVVGAALIMKSTFIDTVKHSAYIEEAKKIPRKLIISSLGIPHVAREAATFLERAVWKSGVEAAVQGGAEAKAGTQAAAYAAHDVAQVSAKTSTQSLAKNGVQVADDVAQVSAKTSTQSLAKNGAQVADDAAQVSAKSSTQSLAKNGAQAADDTVKGGWKIFGKSQTDWILALDTAFLVWDVIDLGFTIHDLVQNKGSEKAKDLREMAKEIEDTFIH
ncbi:hypothetical protein AWC38_SpisGene15006 [Stylophora pistillata]|uniref:Uncharacterized protein n=1 Tax=Stylophora pistillata TaxID=50429 RepID=A0A2B4RSH2_STYPI|nr:hypothetical protein AWC38_SpisGene15006 [Stylophora pistillata]